MVYISHGHPPVTRDMAMAVVNDIKLEMSPCMTIYEFQETQRTGGEEERELVLGKLSLHRMI